MHPTPTLSATTFPTSITSSKWVWDKQALPARQCQCLLMNSNMNSLSQLNLLTIMNTIGVGRRGCVQVFVSIEENAPANQLRKLRFFIKKQKINLTLNTVSKTDRKYGRLS